MGMFDFKRYDGFTGNIPQRFIDNNMPVCPMCGTKEPNWKLKANVTLIENRVKFRCDNCGCILSASVADFSGLSSNKAATMILTAGNINALTKLARGKKVGTVYMTLEEVGTVQKDKSLQGKDIPLDELKQMANKT